MLPLSIKVTGRPASCILDGALALSSLGLLFALRAARDMNVWLVRRLWALLDDTAYQGEELELGLAGQAEPTPGAAPEPARMLREWWCAWLNGDLSDRFYWVGDARHEHVLPEGAEAQLVRRFELLAHDLDRRFVGRVEARAVTPLFECGRDSLALAATLALESPVIFTTLSPGAEEPLIAAQAHAAQLACRALEPASAAQLVESLLPPWMRPGLAQLTLAGFAAVAVHVVAPRALALDPSLLTDEGWSGDTHLWDDAVICWHRLR